MSTTASITSAAPLQVTVVTDNSISHITGDFHVSVGADSFDLPIDQKHEVNPVVQSDSTGHAWSVVSDDQSNPRTVVFQY
jgi:hypothetical protein